MASPTGVLSSFDERERWSFVVVDVCDYGRQGLVCMLKETTHIEGKKEVFACLELDIVLSLRRPAGNSNVMQCLVVRLPTIAREALVMLLQLSELVQSAAIRGLRVVVLSPFSKMLTQRLMGVMGMDELATVDARLPTSLLCREIGMAIKQEPQVQEGWRVFSVLSPRERKALFLSLQNRDVHQQARSRHISPKTVYAQRRGALRRLGVSSILSLLRLLNAKKYQAA
ncbi:LuxR C-terminal-related transcriptional regulator [Serratia bockelmannii]|uniref:helix-turn-helix transcriptional regulator n=1 Tax=Serratia bockelmannii TaxID=2703793 RepID=UPI0022402B56|nr:LuxR C-terminal-related transcriptional regulator [Serratia bockelmannii]MCW7649159.1 LuxR C-terminal-related transcriptional regulator [Serratia bockelmannii]MCW7659206.1 LuxR C-terminal-related transcriptional regulator [Serratia bockelmannii]MCW7678990.1 LuxR C-terminal-related transcriptional regulator [Serratia bockelmannii]MCW7683767.1 LuxR C-terminal-related transcriptional regulator [Serratia bockelmannii]MCW7688544.1 LuxR C-terminal-related transcriptional regulator [Serratia bocke